MHPRLLPVLAAGALTLSLLGPVAAVADDPEPTGTSLPAQASAHASEQASEVLDEAQAIVADRSPAAARRLLAEGGADATLALNQLLRVRDDLPPSERREANALLARPTAPGGDGFADYRVREATPQCRGDICVHYVRRTADAPPRADADRDRVPDAVEQTLSIARNVHRTYVGAGYRRPDSDGKRGPRRAKVDIYLADLGNSALYGYCTTDQRGRTANRWAYCGIDDDFAASQFPSNTPTENRQVTLAHEYFHAVQFAYDAFEDPWFMEATATWAEDEVYDSIDDNRQYLAAGQLGAPRVALDLFDRYAPDGYGHYGNWIFFRYLTERWAGQVGSLPRLVLDAWRNASGRSGAADMYSTRAVDAALFERGSSFTGAYGDFAVANRDPRLTYEEGAAYEQHVPLPSRTHTLSPGGSADTSILLDHLTSVPVAFLPNSTEPGSSLQLTVGLPAAGTAPVARAVVHLTDDTTATYPLEPSADGHTATVPFTTGEVEDVELVLANASLRTQCLWRTDYACGGSPRDDDVTTTYTATVTVTQD